MLIIHYISLAHLAGGFMLIVGIVTRLAAAIQIPILFGAVFFVHLQDGFISTEQDFEFTVSIVYTYYFYHFRSWKLICR